MPRHRPDTGAHVVGRSDAKPWAEESDHELSALVGSPGAADTGASWHRRPWVRTALSWVFFALLGLGLGLIGSRPDPEGWSVFKATRYCTIEQHFPPYYCPRLQRCEQSCGDAAGFYANGTQHTHLHAPAGIGVYAEPFGAVDDPYAVHNVISRVQKDVEQYLVAGLLPGEHRVRAAWFGDGQCVLIGNSPNAVIEQTLWDAGVKTFPSLKISELWKPCDQRVETPCLGPDEKSEAQQWHEELAKNLDLPTAAPGSMGEAIDRRTVIRMNRGVSGSRVPSAKDMIGMQTHVRWCGTPLVQDEFGSRANLLQPEGTVPYVGSEYRSQFSEPEDWTAMDAVQVGKALIAGSGVSMPASSLHKILAGVWQYGTEGGSVTLWPLQYNSRFLMRELAPEVARRLPPRIARAYWKDIVEELGEDLEGYTYGAENLVDWAEKWADLEDSDVGTYRNWKSMRASTGWQAMAIALTQCTSVDLIALLPVRARAAVLAFYEEQHGGTRPVECAHKSDAEKTVRCPDVSGMAYYQEQRVEKEEIPPESREYVERMYLIHSTPIERMLYLYLSLSGAVSHNCGGA